MTEATVTSNAGNVKPRVEESREDSTEVITRLEHGNTPVAELSSRMEGVPPSRKEGSEERGVLVDRRVGHVHQRDASDPSVTGNGEVAELFCRDRFGGAAVDMGFERGLVVDCATGWNMKNNMFMYQEGNGSSLTRAVWPGALTTKTEKHERFRPRTSQASLLVERWADLELCLARRWSEATPAVSDAMSEVKISSFPSDVASSSI